ncbi:hypothetical protein ACFXP7_07515 [Microbacterium sp. P06]|uniref:hypothetical protein n=1 Tax=unclassified Microbacterium TaxID=2609290 RepID=UPI003746ED9A
MALSPTPRPRLAPLTALSLSMVGVGAALLLVGTVLDFGGFWGGFALGGGVMLAVAGAYFSGYARGLRRAGSAAIWLPSSSASE